MLRQRICSSAVRAISGLVALPLFLNVPPALAQSSSQIIVRSASDPATRMLVGDIALPPEAFIVPDAFTMLGMKVEIAGGSVPASDLANSPGRDDARPRVLHTGTEAVFKTDSGAVAPNVDLQLRPDWMLSHHIDVGQGNATLLEFSCGLALIDTGGQETATFKSTERLLEYLDSVFMRRPDLKRTVSLVVLTHPHIDHTLGAKGWPTTGPNAIKIGSVVTNASTKTTGPGWPGQKNLRDIATKAHVPITLVNNEDIVRSDGLTSGAIDPINCAGVNPDIRVLWGTDSRGHSWAANENNASVVVRVDFGESSFLFTGDMEDKAQPEFLQSYLRNPDIIAADVYQVGHHGSKNGTTAALLKFIHPEIAVIGSGNPSDQEPGFSAFNFGHPNHTTIALLSDPAFGVSKTRPLGRFAVGLNGKSPNGKKPPRFQVEDISKAIFSTGWDGDIIIAASAAGEKVVQID
jgi:competence protein ComEC